MTSIEVFVIALEQFESLLEINNEERLDKATDFLEISFAELEFSLNKLSQPFGIFLAINFILNAFLEQNLVDRKWNICHISCQEL